MEMYVLYIQSLDRLGRNKQMILEEWQELIQVKKIEIIAAIGPLALIPEEK